MPSKAEPVSSAAQAVQNRAKRQQINQQQHVAPEAQRPARGPDGHEERRAGHVKAPAVAGSTMAVAGSSASAEEPFPQQSEDEPADPSAQ